MDAKRIGALIRALRVEKGMTQRELAARLQVSDKAVSKWERAMGCPDVSLLPALSQVLGVQIGAVLSGSLNPNERDGGNMRRIRFYVCPVCGNVIAATGEAQIACCGRNLEALEPRPCDEAHAVTIEPMDGELYLYFGHEIAFDHGMSKAHHIRFVAAAGFDRVLLVRLYPEQGGELRMPDLPQAALYIGCSRDGLYVLKR